MLKFGGSALRDGAAIRRAVGIVAAQAGGAATRRPLVVVSAHEGVTRLLDEVAGDAARGLVRRDLRDRVRVRHRSILRELGLSSELLDRHLRELEAVLGDLAQGGVGQDRVLDRRTRDHVLSFGERMSARVVAAALRDAGHPATPVDAFDLGLVGERRDGRTLPVEGARARVRAAVEAVPGIAVVTGFVALDPEGHVTTLGANGSDLTAAWMAETLAADELQLWKTVDGVLTADPGPCPDARLLPRLSYREAAELAAHGADVLHPAAMAPAERAGIPVRIRNAEDPEAPGTRIEELEERAPGPLALAHRPRVALVTERIDLTRDAGEELTALHEACRAQGLDPHLLALLGTEAALLLPDEPDHDAAFAALARRPGHVQLERDLASLVVVGPGVGQDLALDSEVHDAVGARGLAIHHAPVGGGPLSRVYLLEARNLEAGLQAVHRALLVEGRPQRSSA